MSKTREVVSDGGISFLGALTLLFIGLKLGNVIDWNWIWVLSPLWIPVALLAAIFLLVIIVAILVGIFKK